MAKRGGRSGRKYVRDNRGRFATTGATARGGRLKTKSGKKRATQTVKTKTGGKPAGAIKGKIKRDPGAAKPTARSKPTAARTSKAATNTISRSPRQLNKDEKIARDVMTDKRFKSDRQRITEMQRRGVKPNVDVIGLVAKVRSKQGGGTTGKIKPAAAKPAAAKRKSKKVSADKVDRIIGRLRKDPLRKESIGMSSRATKSRNTRETRTRALDFINKAAGLTLKGKGSRPENPKGLDRGQMVSNIASKLAKPTKRSTLKNNSKVVAQRQQVRKSSREATASLRSSVKRQSRSAGPSYAPGRVRLMPPRVAAASGTRPFYTDNKGRIFSGRTSFGSTKASRQSKLQSVRKLRGTGGLGSSISQIKRSKASQKTIGGGTQITFGRFRTGFQERRRS